MSIEHHRARLESFGGATIRRATAAQFRIQFAVKADGPQPPWVRSRPNRMSPEAAGVLERHRWPGNLRELRNAIERAGVLSRSDTIAPEDLPDSIFRDTRESGTSSTHLASLEAVEREHIVRVLAESTTLEEAAA